ncbi:MAG: hypothetical protein KDE46_25335, partial [Caldilineaceae bacterium]|nr:hypothetical protein [Caldilineaceae bacterium]
ADYFCTCDDRLLRRAKTVSNLNIVVVTPLELVEELNIMIAETKPLAEITHEAIRILFREMGVVNTVRFINQYTAGYGNYTEERRELFAEQTLEDLVSKIKQRRERSIKSEPNAE